MKKILLTLLLLMSLTNLFADSVTESDEYAKMVEYKGLYDKAYEEGDYEAALEYAKKYKEYTELVKALVDAELARLNQPEPEPEPEPGPDIEEEMNRLRQQIAEALNGKIQTLEELGAAIILPEEYNDFLEEIDRIIALLDDPDNREEAEQAYNNLLDRLNKTEQALITNLNYLESLLALAEEDLYEAEQFEAYFYAEEEMKLASDSYFEGDKAFKNLMLSEAEEQLMSSRFYSAESIRISRIMKERQAVDMLLDETRQLIEENSRIVKRNEQGLLRWSDPWSSETFLQQNPLKDYSPVERYRLNEALSSGLLPYQEELRPQSEGEEVKKESKTDYLQSAITLWENGVLARNREELTLASDYFRQSTSFVNLYKKNLKSESYKVLENGSKADSLWLISLEIYGTAFLWPLIFEENQETIKDPWLIYPNQELFIPTP